MNKILRIHNPMAALPGFGFKGIEAYSTRAMTDSGGVTVVADCGGAESLRATHGYLREVGLGPEELVMVKAPMNGDLYQAIRESGALTNLVRQLVLDEHYKLEFFCTREDIEHEFVADLGLDWGHVISHPSTLADFWNNKTSVREIARENGLEGVFPTHKVVRDTVELDETVREMLAEHGEVVIKRPMWASGLGMVFGTKADIVERYIVHHGGVPKGTIVERSLGVKHTAMSIVVRFDGGRAVDRWFTEQECPIGDGSVSHEGSVLGDMPNVTRVDTNWMMEATAPFYQLVARSHPRLTGIVNFDCIRAGEERFIVECNARVTFSTYVHGIRRAVLAARGIKDHTRTSAATCIVGKVTPRTARDFNAVKSALGPTILKNLRQPGVVPIVLGCLSTAGYCYLVAVGDTYGEAFDLMKEARTKLEA